MILCLSALRVENSSSTLGKYFILNFWKLQDTLPSLINIAIKSIPTTNLTPDGEGYKKALLEIRKIHNAMREDIFSRSDYTNRMKDIRNEVAAHSAKKGTPDLSSLIKFTKNYEVSDDFFSDDLVQICLQYQMELGPIIQKLSNPIQE